MQSIIGKNGHGKYEKDPRGREVGELGSRKNDEPCNVSCIYWESGYVILSMWFFTFIAMREEMADDDLRGSLQSRK